MRKLPTAERRQEVERLYLDQSLPISERSSRALGRRFGVSHRTILNDLAKLEIEYRLEKPTAAGISSEELEQRVAQLYPTHTYEEIAAKLGCSKTPIAKAVHKLELEIRASAPRRTRPNLPDRDCDCGCGGTFEPDYDDQRFIDWQHYTAWRDSQGEAVAAEAAPLYDSGMTLDEIVEARPHLARHRVHRALHAFSETAIRRRGKRPIHVHGRHVKCRARGYDFCPHGETERWIHDSEFRYRPAEFLSSECWARYRLKERIETMRGAWTCIPDGKVRSKLLGKLEGTLAAKKAAAEGKIGVKRGYTEDDVARVRKLKGEHPAWGRGSIANAIPHLTEKQVRGILAQL